MEQIETQDVFNGATVFPLSKERSMAVTAGLSLSKYAILAGTIPMLMACTSENTPPAADCPASAYRSLIGASLAAVSLPAGLQTVIIGPGDTVPTETGETVMVIETDASRVIRRIYCR